MRKKTTCRSTSRPPIPATDDMVWRRRKAAALFSGGKDCLYATYIARQQGLGIHYLITLLPSLPTPSPHARNLDALKLLAQCIGVELLVVDLRKGTDEFVKTLGDLAVDCLVGGDVCVAEHFAWLKRICDRAGKQLVEPLYGRETLKVIHDILELGFIAMIIGIDNSCLSEEWLGYELRADTVAGFLANNTAIDPLGENGEYHTIVLESPLHEVPLEVETRRKLVENEISYLEITARPRRYAENTP